MLRALLGFSSWCCNFCVSCPNIFSSVLQVGTDVRGFPHAPRPPHMPYHMGQGLPGFTGYGPPAPPPHGWTWGPQAQLVPATHGKMI